MRNSPTVRLGMALLIIAFSTTASLNAQTGGPARRVPRRQYFEGAESFRKELGTILGVTPGPGVPIYLDGQRLYYEEGPGGRNPAVCVVDWGLKSGDIRVVQAVIDGRPLEGAVVVADNAGSADSLAMPLANAAAPARVEDEILRFFDALALEGTAYDPQRFWSGSATNAFIPGEYRETGMVRAAYGLYRIWLGRKNYRTAEVYLSTVLLRSSWCASLFREWAELQSMAGKAESVKTLALARFLDTQDSRPVGPVGQGLAELALSPPKSTVSISLRPYSEYERFDAQRIARFLEDLALLADADTKGALAYDLALFLSRKPGQEASAAKAAEALRRDFPEFAKKLQSQRIIDLEQRFSVSGDPALVSIVDAEIRSWFRSVVE